MEDFNSSVERPLESNGILPKEKWLAYVKEKVQEAQENKQELSVVIIDIDNMKTVNDTLGHFPADEVVFTLKDTIDLITNVFRTKAKPGYENRQPDILGYIPDEDSEISPETSTEFIPMDFSKLGGDEFGGICFTDEEGVKRVVERLRQAFSESSDDRLRALDVDLAIGTSTLRPGMSYINILHEADIRMFDDKISHLDVLEPRQEQAIRDMWMQTLELGIKPRNIIKYWVQLGYLAKPSE